jgi:competence protein ComEC
LIIGIVGAILFFDFILPFLYAILLGWVFVVVVLFGVYFHPKFQFLAYSWVFGVIAFIVMFFSGQVLVICSYDFFQASFYEKFFSKKNELMVLEITEKPIEKDNWIKCFCKVNAVCYRGGFRNASGKTLVYLKKDSLAKLLNYGDRVLVYGYFQKLQAPANPNAFNFKWFLGLSNIHHQGFISSANWR